MEIYERIRYLRKNILNLTQDEFAKPICSRSNLGNIESGRIAVTDRTILDICREYNVNETWLRTGEGEMFLKRSTEDEIAAFMGDILKDEEPNFRRRFISALARLDDAGWDALGKFISDFNEQKESEQE